MGHQEARGASRCAGGKLGHEMGRRKAEFLGTEAGGKRGQGCQLLCDCAYQPLDLTHSYRIFSKIQNKLEEKSEKSHIHSNKSESVGF